MKNAQSIAVIGSHSALDVCRGAKDEGFNTLVICQKGREKTYDYYYKTHGNQGCVDECLILDKFSDILLPTIQKQLKKRNVIFVPNRSFEVYLQYNYDAIENDFDIPIFGNKFLLKLEERSQHPNQYDFLRKGHIRYPKQFSNPMKIDRLSLVKVAEKSRPYERAFFLTNSFNDYKKKSFNLLKGGKITKQALDKAIIEEFTIGALVNFNFFYSPITKRLELLGTDTRRQTNLDGLLRLPAAFQTQLGDEVEISFEEAGHFAVTVVESLLERAFELGEAFVKASKELCPPGIIGPFALQTIITAGPPKKDIVVIDVSPRMPGSPGIAATPYTNYLFGESLSVGRRIAKEIRYAYDSKLIDKIIT